MADTLQSLSLLVLEQKYRGRIIDQINRRSTLLRLLRLIPGQGKNCAWVVKGTGQVAENYSEGADASNFGSNTQSSAILSWALYRANFHTSGTARRTAALSNTPEGIENLLVNDLEEAAAELTSLINQKLYTGAGTGTTIAGLDVAIGDDTNTYATIDRGTSTFWQPYVVDPGSLTPLTFAQIRTDQATIYDSCGEMPDIAMCSSAVYNTIGSLFDDKRQFVQEVRTARGLITLDAGYGALMFEGTMFLKDKDAPANTIYYLNSNRVEIEYLPPPPDFMGDLSMPVMSEDGYGTIPLGFQLDKLAKSGDSDKYELLANLQLCVRRPNSCGVRLNVDTV